MSHYTVAVITRTGTEEEIEELLAPFDENIEVEKYISRTYEQIVEAGKERKEKWIRQIQTGDISKEQLIEYLTHPSYQWRRVLLAAETDEDFYKAEAYEEEVGPDGNEWTTYNPNSKWDWYTIGGRWSNSLRDYNGDYYNTLKIAYWDYNYMSPTAIERYSRIWDVIVEGAKRTEEEEKEWWGLYNSDYYREKYGNKSEYIKTMLTFSTYAVLTADGEWLAPGKMGMFGLSLAEPEDECEWEKNFTKLIDTFDKNMYITIVDCHI